MDATNCVGYFLSNFPPSHNSVNGANRWIEIDAANKWIDEAKIRGSLVAPPWLNGGSFEWPIPAQWHIGTNGPANSMPGWNQVFELDSNGTVKITKFGKWTERGTNGIIDQNWED